MFERMVISAASHERRVAILEKGQLSEITSSGKKEFRARRSIYKEKSPRPARHAVRFVTFGPTATLSSMSVTFGKLEDYDHGHPHEQPQSLPAIASARSASPVELLAGESLARAKTNTTKRRTTKSSPDEAHHLRSSTLLTEKPRR